MSVIVRVYRWFLIISIMFVLAGCASPMPEANPPVERIRVVMDNNYPPYVFMDDEGNPQGILIDQWKLWEQKTGIKVEITTMPWAEALEAMRQNKFDVIDTVFITSERAEWLDFTEPYADVNVRIFFNKKISGLAKVQDLKGFRVAVKIGDANVDYLLENGITDLVYYESYEKIVKAAAESRENVFVVDEPPALHFLFKYKAQGQFNYSEPLYGGQFHRAVARGNDFMMKIVEDGFNRISASEIEAIHGRWFGYNQAERLQQYLSYLSIGLALAAVIILGLFIFNRLLQVQVQRRTHELHQALAELRKSEASQREVLEFLPIPISAADEEGKILLLNRKFTENYGYTIQDIPTIQQWMTLAYPDPKYRKHVLDVWDKDVADAVARSTTTPVRTYKITAKDGRLCDVEIVMHPVGKLWVGTFNDVTERFRAENALRASEEKYRTLIETINTGIFISTLDGKFIQANSAVVEMSGYGTLDEFMKIPASSLYADIQDRQRLIAELQEHGFVRNVELRSAKKDGTLYWISLSAVLLKDEAGKPSFILGSVTDITERKNAEALIQKSEQRWRILIEKSADALTLIDKEGRVIYEGPTVQRLTGYASEERVGKSGLANIYPEDLPYIRQLLAEVLSQPGNTVNAEFRSVRKDGSVWWIDATATNLLHDPIIEAIVVNYRDVTNRKQAEIALREREAEVRKLNASLEQRVAERTQQLELANKELESFAYSVSHDLRAPLRAVDGYSHILLEDYAALLPGEGQELIQRLRLANQNMTHLVDALLGLSRMTRAELNREEVNLSDIARSIMDALQQASPHRKVTWSITDGMTVYGDARLLRVVLENLLGNAWKFTSRQEEAHIEFGTEMRGGDRIFYVRDNGAGFNPEYIGKLFGAFQRLHRADEFEGTGIGLATVQRIIHRHGGRVWADGKVGAGAVFYFTLA